MDLANTDFLANPSFSTIKNRGLAKLREALYSGELLRSREYIEIPIIMIKIIYIHMHTIYTVVRFKEKYSGHKGPLLRVRSISDDSRILWECVFIRARQTSRLSDSVRSSECILSSSPKNPHEQKITRNEICLKYKSEIFKE